jgi:hypothetical protein
VLFEALHGLRGKRIEAAKPCVVARGARLMPSIPLFAHVPDIASMLVLRNLVHDRIRLPNVKTMLDRTRSEQYVIWEMITDRGRLLPVSHVVA